MKGSKVKGKRSGNIAAAKPAQSLVRWSTRQSFRWMFSINRDGRVSFDPPTELKNDGKSNPYYLLKMLFRGLSTIRGLAGCEATPSGELELQITVKKFFTSKGEPDDSGPPPDAVTGHSDEWLEMLMEAVRFACSRPGKTYRVEAEIGGFQVNLTAVHDAKRSVASVIAVSDERRDRAKIFDSSRSDAVRSRLRGLDDAMNEEVTGEEEKSAAWEVLLGELPATYSECYAKLLEFSHAFHNKLASTLQSRLNLHLRSMPQDTYQEKQVLASWVNGELRELGLAIRDPKTGKPATLIADIRGGEDDTSRFRFDVRGDDGRHARTFTANFLPVFELMEDEPRREGLAKQR